MKCPALYQVLLATIASALVGYGCTSSSSDPESRHLPDAGYQPRVSLQVSSPLISEGDSGTSSLSFVLTLSGPSTSPVTVSFVTHDGSAVAGKDYIQQKGSVTFDPGTTQKSVDVDILGDQIDEHDEQLYLKLGSDSNVSIAAAQAIGNIQDDDDPPLITVGNASVTEGNAGFRKLLFPVSLSTPSGKTVSVDFVTENSGAEAPADYVHAGGQLTFAPGVTMRSVPIHVAGDTADEGDEFLTLKLQNAINATIAIGSGIGTIVNDDPVSGLSQRPANPGCIAPDQPTVNTSIETALVFPDVGSFSVPLAMLQAPGDSSQWYVVEQGGVIYRFDNAVSATGRSTFIDVSDRADAGYNESGLLGMAFHPNYADNGFVYVSYTATGPDGTYELTSRLSRFQSLDGGLTLDPATEFVLLSQDQRYHNHNGGHITFGPDGYLYFGLGDSGSSGDPQNRSQNTKNLFGSLTRIDVDSGSPYGIPIDNPFAGNPLCDISTTGTDAAAACPEIYAWGLRNPWRWSFDGSTGDIWLADVGQNAYEEVDIIELGGNYGWRIQEGFACFNPSSACNTTGLVQPILAYDHSVGQSITGGYVYRGTEIPELIGRYVFADYIAGKLFATTALGDGTYDYEQLADTGFFISSFAEDETGELYFLDYLGGTIRRIHQFGGTSNDTIPQLITDTGCVNDLDPTKPAAGLIPYATNLSFWSDGAEKDRYLAIPDGLTIDVDINGDWQFPIGTVLVKNFRLFGKMVETRHFMRHTNGDWGGYTYEWNDDETQAVRVVGGKNKVINGQTWIFPNETQCMNCHTGVAGFSLGAEHAQLNRDFRYPDTGITANQLYTFDAIDVLTDPLPDSPENLPSITGLAAAGYVLDFNAVPTNSYSNQDKDANVAVADGGATLSLSDNTQRKTIRTFNITPDTILEFDFFSTVEGEVQGIGFDENENISDAVRIFQVYGVQNWSGSNHDFDSYAGSGRVHYTIPVGQYYTGSDMHLLLINDDDAGLGSNSRFSNVRVINCQNCLDFNIFSTSSYSNQDGDKNVSAADDGATLVLTGNTWRKTNQVFEVTAETYVSFDFESTLEGEIHSIGFDENNEWNDGIRMFRLYGTQNNGDIKDYETYTGPGRTHYQIPVGQYYTGAAMHLVFANDDDSGIGSDSRFSNVKVISCADCLNFNVMTTSPYAGQDVSANVSAATGGATLVLTDNTWRRTDQAFDVTVNTVLEFDFESQAEGEVHGIGFDDNDNSGDAIRIFKLFGSENGALITDFDRYSGSGIAHFRIPVGLYYTGSAMRLVFVNDDDALTGSDSRFRNVRVHEIPLNSAATPSLKDQVRSYLHTNCAGCHRPSGPTTSNMDLRFDTSWPAMNVCDVIPTLGSLGIADAKLIAPGDAARSVLVNRISRRDAHGMPPLASNMIDYAGVSLLTSWINGLTSCPQ